MTKISHDALARTITKAGIILIESGAETMRVEDTMNRLALAFGATVTDAYATPTLLMISFSINGQLVHNIKRVHIKATNLEKIDMVNTLSRQACQKEIDLEQLDHALDTIALEKPYSIKVRLFGAAICSFGFAYFFGGGLNEALNCIWIGIVTQLVVEIFDYYHISAIFRYMLSGAILTACALFSEAVFHANKDLVIISVIMLLVPGLAITNAIKDSVNGDLVSGISRGTEAILIAISIAIGSGFCLLLLGGIS